MTMVLAPKAGMVTTGNGHKVARPLAHPVCLADLVDTLVADAEETLRAASEGRPRGAITGIPMLDAAMGHALQPGLHVWTGDPGSGKTALALQTAASCGCPALYVAAEQSPLSLFRRHIARVTGTPLDTLRMAVPTTVRTLAERAAATAPMLALLDATVGAATVEQITELATALRERFSARNVLLVVDAAQPWARGLMPEGAEYEVTQAGLSALVGVASRLTAPIITLSHRNRASTRDRGPSMTAAKGSADFEHMAEAVLHLTRDGNGTGGPVEISVFIAKNRHGRAGYSLPLSFDEETQAIQ